MVVINKGYKVSRTRLLEISKYRSAEARAKYAENPIRCLDCGTPIIYEKRHDNKFCNSSCSARYNNTRRAKKYVCVCCGNPVKERHGKYCSSKCQWEIYDENIIKQWLAGNISGNNNATAGSQLKTSVRRWCLERAKHKCEICGWAQINPTTKRIPLQIHHKNGNPDDSTSDNLQVLCPNCHSLTPTFGVLNKGNGRKSRYKRI